MCGRYSLTISKKDILARFGAQDACGELKPRFNLAPSQPAPAVAPAPGGRVLMLMRWGLLPPWAPSPAERGQINARCETVAEKPAFRRLVDRNRCLVPADGFYEWRRESGGRSGVPVRFVLRSREPFAFAGLWSEFRDPAGGDPLRTFTILTTRPNALVAAVHDRMPVILPPEMEAAWTDPERPLSSLPATWRDPRASEEMEAYEVSKAVNDIRHDTPDCLQPPAGRQPSLF